MLIPLVLLTVVADVTTSRHAPRPGLRIDVPAGVSCPLDSGRRGYPLAVTFVDSSVTDTAFLTAFARSAAYRWQVPSGRRGLYAGWQRVRRRLLPPEPRWADDWKPGPQHRARLAVTLYRDGRRPDVSVVTASGDKRFDASLESMVLQPLPSAPALPPLPATGANSLRVEIHLGERPSPSAAHIEFAIEQEPVRLVAGTLRVQAPPTSRSPRATVKYDVNTDGLVVLDSFEALESSDPAFARAVQEALSRAHFTPAESNCRKITMTVVQTFGT